MDPIQDGWLAMWRVGKKTFEKSLGIKNLHRIFAGSEDWLGFSSEQILGSCRLTDTVSEPEARNFKSHNLTVRT